MASSWLRSSSTTKILLKISATFQSYVCLKHKNTQPLYIFNKENPQNSEPQNGPRRGLDFIALLHLDNSNKIWYNCSERKSLIWKIRRVWTESDPLCKPSADLWRVLFPLATVCRHNIILDMFNFYWLLNTVFMLLQDDLMNCPI